MNIAHPDRLAVCNRPLLAPALERLFDIHSRIAAFETKLHLRAGMVPIDRNLLDLAVHRGEIQVRSAAQVLFDAGADGVLIAHLLSAAGCQSTQNCQHGNQVPSIHSLGLSFRLCDILPRIHSGLGPNLLSYEDQSRNDPIGR